MSAIRKVLVIDDDVTTHIIITRFLENKYDVVVMSEAKAALQYLKRHTPDLILLDIEMPTMSGFEFMEIIKDKSQYSLENVPVIFMTSGQDTGVESKTFTVGGADYIRKPFTRDVFCSRVDNVMATEERRRSLSAELIEKKQMIKELLEEAGRDDLTGLLNRAYAQDAVDKLLSKGIHGAMFMMDMDRFKAINDMYGHELGDEVLRQFAGVIKECVREDDIICRNGGDEFVMFVVGMTSESELSIIARRIINGIKQFLSKSEISTGGSVSIGIAIAPNAGEDFSSLYKAADKALYFVKMQGRSNYSFYHDDGNFKEEANLVKLDYLNFFLKETRAMRLAYQVDFEQFHSIYNFISRYIERNEHDMQVILFTLRQDSGTSEILLEETANLLEKAIRESLRQSDVSTRFSKKQQVVLLMDSDDENAKRCADRILTRLGEIHGINVTYEIAKMDPAE